MPLIRVDFIKGRSEEEIARLLDATRSFMVSTFKVSRRDCTYLVGRHASLNFVKKVTRLEIEPTERVIVVTIPKKPRAHDWQFLFYDELCLALTDGCDIDPSDVIIKIDMTSETD